MKKGKKQGGHTVTRSPWCDYLPTHAHDHIWQLRFGHARRHEHSIRDIVHSSMTATFLEWYGCAHACVTVTLRGRSFKLFSFFIALTGSTSMPWGKSSAAIFQRDIVRMRSVIVLLCIFLRSLRGLFLFFVKPKLLLFATLLSFFFLRWCLPWSPWTPPLDLQ